MLQLTRYRKYVRTSVVRSGSPKTLFTLLSLTSVLTIIFSLIESYFLYANSKQNLEKIVSKVQDHCWINEDYEILDDCQQCSAVEIESLHPLVCSLTGYRRHVRCEISGDATQSCNIGEWKEEITFWIFEAIWALLGVLAGLIIALRRLTIENRHKYYMEH